MFESQDAVTKMYLKDKLHTLKMKENESVTKHIHVFRSHLEQLSATGCPTQDDEAILTLMRSLPPSYRSFISSLRRQPGITLQSLITDLIQEETLMKDMNLNMDNTSALYVGKKHFYNNKKPHYNKTYKKFSNSKDESSSQPFEKKKNYSVDKKCFYCKKPGHLIQDCRTRIAAKKRKQSNMVVKPNRLYVVALITNEMSTSTWYVDSGATQHMCHESNAFTNYTKYENQQSVYLGDDSTSYKIEGLGDVTVRLSNGMEKTIPDVLHVPGLAKNLFSAKQLDRAGGEIRIKSGISILLNKSGQTIAKCKLNPDLYELGTTVIPNKKILAIPATIQSLSKADLWHLRLGHINQYRLKQIQSKSKGIDIFDVHSMTFCSSRVEGKQHKSKFLKGGGKRAIELLGLIHSDICGPMQVGTHSGCKYFITFIDDLSRYCHTYLMRQKSEAFDKFILYKNFVEKQTNYKIKILRSNHGGEYMADSFNNLCKEQGIKQEFTTTYTPQQNGVSERKN